MALEHRESSPENLNSTQPEVSAALGVLGSDDNKIIQDMRDQKSEATQLAGLTIHEFPKSETKALTEKQAETAKGLADDIGAMGPNDKLSPELKDRLKKAMEDPAMPTVKLLETINEQLANSKAGQGNRAVLDFVKDEKTGKVNPEVHIYHGNKNPTVVPFNRPQLPALGVESKAGRD